MQDGQMRSVFTRDKFHPVQDTRLSKPLISKKMRKYKQLKQDSTHI